MGDIRKTYDIDYKRKAVAMFLEEGHGYKTVVKALDINDKMVRRWVTHYEKEGIEGLKKKRGTTTWTKERQAEKAH
ncbi:helix-turn-helix domain containing protein [Paenibacillus sp. N3/727]|uniref:helix-turn-helix domain-containing protein n=1 Tax=Paenibacillus sp. N3/727 TaxID=2925845 RepID=UPI001F536D82|nr:helix-turn-helix domain-containing protein [Paenibacillus sp. N3/727]UNK21137.1 helix-turn-helix domain containing protein [Paenibacillus sp. N3/727]